MSQLFKSVVEIVRNLVKQEAARLVAWTAGAAAAAAVAVATHFGLELSAEFVAGVSAFAAIVATEVIRQLVYSEQTVKELVGEQNDGDTP